MKTAMRSLLPPPGANLFELVRHKLAGSGRTVLATDFDGTLAPIVSTPERAHAPRAVLEALGRLAASGVPIAVVTGRSLGDLAARLLDLPGVALVGDHGASIRLPGGTLIEESPAPEALSALHAIAKDAMRAGLPGLRVETKRTSVALHTRQVAPEWRSAANALLKRASAWAHYAGLERILGREVLELRASSMDKGKGLARVCEALGGEPGRVIYAGDDTTDIPALHLAAQSPKGLGVFVLSSERPRRLPFPRLAYTTCPRWGALLVRLSLTRAPRS